MSEKILILDDEQDYMVTLRDFLSELNYAVAATMFPKHALEIISKEKPKIVLFDYKLPDMDGDRFLKKAKELSAETNYILITAYRDDVIVDKFKGLGVLDVILKPVNLQELLKKIQDILKDGK